MASLSQGDELRRFLDRKPAKVVAVCSGKGGVGKTNVAANIAVALAALRRNVCLFDADVSLANVDVLLGLQPRFNLAHVVNGQTSLEQAMLQGPKGLNIIPASSGNFDMTNLEPRAQVGLIQAFSELTEQPDIMVVDTSAGILPVVARFVQAAQHPIVVLCDEPASLTDAYALIKVFSGHYGISRFHVVTNQSRKPGSGRSLFRKLTRVTDTYLDVVLRHLGDIPQDDYLVRAVQEQRAVVDSYPRSASGRAFLELASAIDGLPAARECSGGIEFFFERMLLNNTRRRGQVA